MKKHNFQKIRVTLFLSLLAIIVFSCTRDDSAFDDVDRIKKEKLLRLKTTPTTRDFTGDFSNARSGFNVGLVKGDVTMDLSAFGIIEHYTFKAISVNGKIMGKFSFEDYDPVSGEVFFSAEGIITCMAIEEDCKTVRLGGEVTEALGYPELPENHFAVFTVVANPNGTNMATPVFSGQFAETLDLHCSTGIPVEDEFWWGTFMEVEGNIKIISKDCKKNKCRGKKPHHRD